MAVYVDPLFEVTPRMITGHWQWPQACHMTADSTEELLDFAEKLRLKARWIQHVGKPTEHFDLNASKRKEAVKLGAVEIDAKRAVAKTIAKLLVP